MKLSGYPSHPFNPKDVCMVVMITLKAATRLLILKRLLLLALLCASPVAGYKAHGGSPALTLREKDVKKGERIVAELRRLEQLTAKGATDFRGYRALINRMYPDLFIKVSELGDGDLRGMPKG